MFAHTMIWFLGFFRETESGLSRIRQFLHAKCLLAMTAFTVPGYNTQCVNVRHSTQREPVFEGLVKAFVLLES